MTCEVATTTEYEERLDLAVRYRLKNYGRASAASLVKRQTEIEALLAQTPLVGPTVDRYRGDIPDKALRWVALESYIAIYRYSEGEKRVTLLGLIYGRSDWRRRIGLLDNG